MNYDFMNRERNKMFYEELLTQYFPDVDYRLTQAVFEAKADVIHCGHSSFLGRDPFDRTPGYYLDDAIYDNEVYIDVLVPDTITFAVPQGTEHKITCTFEQHLYDKDRFDADLTFNGAKWGTDDFPFVVMIGTKDTEVPPYMPPVLLLDDAYNFIGAKRGIKLSGDRTQDASSVLKMFQKIKTQWKNFLEFIISIQASDKDRLRILMFFLPEKITVDVSGHRCLVFKSRYGDRYYLDPR